MRLEQLNSLNDNELALCLYIINHVEPKLLPYEISPRLLCSIDDDKLNNYINGSESKLNGCGTDIFNSLRLKLGIINKIPVKFKGYFLWHNNYRGWYRKMSKMLTH